MLDYTLERITLLLLLICAAVVGCAQPRRLPSLGRCEVIAVFPETQRLGQSADAEDEVKWVWPATAIVIKNGPTSGALRPAILLLIAAPDEEELTSEAVLSRTRLAVPCHDADIQGRWLFSAKDGTSLFILSYHSGGTAGMRVLAFSHRAFSSDCWQSEEGLQDHMFYEILNEESRLPVYVGDFDNDGVEELFIASEATNMSVATMETGTYRVISFAGGSAEVLAEVGASDIPTVQGIRPFHK
jgi:hypothetical protein